LIITEEKSREDSSVIFNIFNVSLVDNLDGHEIVQFSWEYQEIKELYDFNLHLIYQAMAQRVISQ
jgi:hypothetical protein